MTDKWKWKGGRLWLGGLSFTTEEAYHLIPTSPHIARACVNVLDTYKAEDDRIFKLERIRQNMKGQTDD